MNLVLFKKRVKQLFTIERYCFFRFLSFFICKLNVWLISERGNEAEDNGLAFYLFMKKNHPEICVKYVIDLNCKDCIKIQKEDRVKKGSFKHYFLYINSVCLISTHYQGCSPYFELFSKLDSLGFIHLKGIQVFLQHGITKDKSEWSRKKRRVNLLICGARSEYQALIKETDYGPGIIKYTGFPRFDNLFLNQYKTTKNVVLVMPTWRMEFSNLTKKEFKKSSYYRNYEMLLNDKRIESLLKEKKLTLIFYPHIEMQRFIDDFHTNNDSVEIADINNSNVQDLLLQSKILITDFSSVFFDFAYLEKPVIYFQFDRENYYLKHYKKGWFSYEKDGFGPIVTSVCELFKELDQLTSYIPSKIYKNRMESFFERKDDKNSERVYEEIIKVINHE